jgi:16S rRNA (cytosine1402-N4)-methyltransferase
VDATFGYGGYTSKILETFPNALVVALDQDPIAIERASFLKTTFGERLKPVLGKFGDIEKLVISQGYQSVDAVVFDVGVSSMQLDDPIRGFSFMKDGPLDMRMPSRGGLEPRCYELPAEAIVNSYSASRLADILYHYGEEKQSRKIAKAIERNRARKPIETTGQLAQIVADTIGQGRFSSGTQLHPATRTFQALRIYVNDEMNQLYSGLQGASNILRLGGLCMVVTFHSLEDRLVKRYFKGELLASKDDESELRNYIKADPGKISKMRRNAFQKEVSEMFEEDDLDEYPFSHDLQSIQGHPPCHFEMLTKRVVKPSQSEIESNPRSRSAKLRPMIKCLAHS